MREYLSNSVIQKSSDDNIMNLMNHYVEQSLLPIGINSISL